MDDLKSYARNIWGCNRERILRTLIEQPDLVAQMVRRIEEGDNCTIIVLGTNIADEKGELVARVTQQITIDLFEK